MAPFDNGYSSNLINKLSPLIEGQVPDFIQADHAVFVRFLKHYYQYLESGELRLTVSIDNMLLEVETKTFLLLEDGNKFSQEDSQSYDEFVPLENGRFTGRVFQFKADLSTNFTDQTPLVDQLGFEMQFENRT